MVRRCASNQNVAAYEGWLRQSTGHSFHVGCRNTLYNLNLGSFSNRFSSLLLSLSLPKLIANEPGVLHEPTMSSQETPEMPQTESQQNRGPDAQSVAILKDASVMDEDAVQVPSKFHCCLYVVMSRPRYGDRQFCLSTAFTPYERANRAPYLFEFRPQRIEYSMARVTDTHRQ